MADKYLEYLASIEPAIADLFKGETQMTRKEIEEIFTINKHGTITESRERELLTNLFKAALELDRQINDQEKVPNEDHYNQLFRWIEKTALDAGIARLEDNKEDGDLE